MKAFVDTSAWYALVNAAEPQHGPVTQSMMDPASRLLTSNFVADEAVTLVRRRIGHLAAVRLGDTLRDAASVDMVRVEPQDEDDAWDLFKVRADKAYSFTDCTSFVLMRRLGIDAALTLDGDFRREGFKVVP